MAETALARTQQEISNVRAAADITIAELQAAVASATTECERKDKALAMLRESYDAQARELTDTCEEVRRLSEADQQRQVKRGKEAVRKTQRLGELVVIAISRTLQTVTHCASGAA